MEMKNGIRVIGELTQHQYMLELYSNLDDKAE